MLKQIAASQIGFPANQTARYHKIKNKGWMSVWSVKESLTGVKRSFEGLDVCGHSRDPVNAHFINPSLLHLLNALPHNVRHLGAFTPEEQQQAKSMYCTWCKNTERNCAGFDKYCCSVRLNPPQWCCVLCSIFWMFKVDLKLTSSFCPYCDIQLIFYLILTKLYKVKKRRRNKYTDESFTIHSITSIQKTCKL